MSCTRTACFCLVSAAAGGGIMLLWSWEPQRAKGSMADIASVTGWDKVIYSKRLGVYDVFEVHADPQTASWWLIDTRDPRGVSFEFPLNGGDAPISYNTASSIVGGFSRRRVASGVSTYAAGVASNGHVGDQIWDRDGDGRFDELVTADGLIYRRAEDNEWHLVPNAHFHLPGLSDLFETGREPGAESQPTSHAAQPRPADTAP
jgi:hypothetical protein